VGQADEPDAVVDFFDTQALTGDISLQGPEGPAVCYMRKQIRCPASTQDKKSSVADHGGNVVSPLPRHSNQTSGIKTDRIRFQRLGVKDEELMPAICLHEGLKCRTIVDVVGHNEAARS
jgi:hypothetical protein